MVPATIQALRIPRGGAKVSHWHVYQISIWDGLGTLAVSGLSAQELGVREKTPQQLGYVSLVETWSLLAKEFWA